MYKEHCVCANYNMGNVQSLTIALTIYIAYIFTFTVAILKNDPCFDMRAADCVFLKDFYIRQACTCRYSILISWRRTSLRLHLTNVASIFLQPRTLVLNFSEVVSFVSLLPHGRH